MTAAAQQRQDPARIGILAAADIHAEPGDIFEPFAPFGARAGIGFGRFDQLFGFGCAAFAGDNQRQRNIDRRHRFEDAFGHGAIGIGGFDRLCQRFEQAFAIAFTDGFG